MTDKAEKPSVEVTEEVEKKKEDKVVEKPEKVENGEVQEKDEDDDDKEKSSENGDDEKPSEENGSDESEDKPAVKRKSTGGGDATDSAVVEGATPEKKAKLDEKESKETKVDAEVEA